MAQVVHKVSAAVVRERIHAAPEQIAMFCRAYHIRWFALFGSVLRDDFRDDSDIDVLVEFDPEHSVTFFDLHDMEEELSGLFRGRTVDLITRTAKTLRYALVISLRRFSARSAQISQMFREAHAEIAWERTDTLYRSVSEDSISINEGMLWEIVTGEVPALIPMLEQMLPPGMRYPPDESGNG